MSGYFPKPSHNMNKNKKLLVNHYNRTASHLGQHRHDYLNEENYTLIE